MKRSRTAVRVALLWACVAAFAALTKVCAQPPFTPQFVPRAPLNANANGNANSDAGSRGNRNGNGGITGTGTGSNGLPNGGGSVNALRVPQRRNTTAGAAIAMAKGGGAATARAPIAAANDPHATAMDGLLSDAARASALLQSGALDACYSVTGAGNNRRQPAMGTSGTPFRRMCPHAYADGISALPRTAVNSRNVSNALQSAGCADIPNHKCASDMLWVFGQFVAHDLSFSPDGGAALTIPIGATDPARMGTIRMTRSRTAPGTTPHEQLTFASGWLDLSQVYGADSVRANALREGIGGRMRASTVEGEEFMPLHVRGADGSAVTNTQPADFPNSGTAAGDMRATEHDALFVVQVLFLRNHNRLASALAAAAAEAGTGASDEALYQAARALNIAQYQSVVFGEFLLMLLGSGAPGAWSGYDDAVDAGITNEFATAAFRLGHSLVGCEIKGFDDAGRHTDTFPIADSFFSPQKVSTPTRYNSMLRGLVLNTAQEMDPKISDALRNRLFAHGAGSGGLDLSAIDIERGRDHGLPSYAAMRQALGLAGGGNDVESALRRGLADAGGGSVGDADPWVGMLSERRAGTSMIGPLGTTVIARQFRALRDGDRCYFQNALAAAPDVVAAAQRSDLLSLMRANTGAKLPMATSAFRNPLC